MAGALGASLKPSEYQHLAPGRIPHQLRSDSCCSRLGSDPI